MKTKIVSLISLLGTGFYLLGGFDNALECLIVVVILDYITGVISAWYNKKLDSKVGLKGIVKKLREVALCGLNEMKVMGKISNITKDRLRKEGLSVTHKTGLIDGQPMGYNLIEW